MLPTYRVSSATSRLCSRMKAVTPAWALLVGCGCDVPAPDRVVTQPQATDPDAVARRAPAVRVTVLVDVAVHDVEVARFLREPMERIPDPIAHPVPQRLPCGGSPRPAWRSPDRRRCRRPHRPALPPVRTSTPSTRIPTRAPSPGERRRLARRARGSDRSPSRRSGTRALRPAPPSRPEPVPRVRSSPVPSGSSPPRRPSTGSPPDCNHLWIAVSRDLATCQSGPCST